MSPGRLPSVRAISHKSTNSIRKGRQCLRGLADTRDVTVDGCGWFGAASAAATTLDVLATPTPRAAHGWIESARRPRLNDRAAT